LSKITSIATGVPKYKHPQKELFSFADSVYSETEADSRKLGFLYRQSGIEYRYSIIPDYTSKEDERIFFPKNDSLEPVPDIEERMKLFNEEAPSLSETVILDCIKGKIDKNEITHLITVSCTGLSAPGLDLQLLERLELQPNVIRTSVNFMGCYAAIHALKMADAFCKSSANANIVIVCTEFCTLHFQKGITIDNLTSSLLFGDGCAAMLIQDDDAGKGLRLQSFFSEVSLKGKTDMAWGLSSTGFLMTLSSYVPDLIKESFRQLFNKALAHAGLIKEHIDYWCIHPGGKKILESISESLHLKKEDLQYSYDILRDYGNMSSPTIIFVLKKMLDELREKTTTINDKPTTIFGAAFGPGLTMETFIAQYD
jgi:predicted naringenin-chalcone synthase